MSLGIVPGEDSGGNQMKITRSFTLDYLVCLELKKQKNQSKFVEEAVREKLQSESKMMKIQYSCHPCDVVYTPRNVRSARPTMICRKCGATLDAESVQ